MAEIIKERKPRTEVNPETLAANPERIYKRLDRLMGELELELTLFIEAIAQPYVERCLKQDPDYEIYFFDI